MIARPDSGIGNGRSATCHAGVRRAGLFAALLRYTPVFRQQQEHK